jgi:hypothetical protein
MKPQELANNEQFSLPVVALAYEQGHNVKVVDLKTRGNVYIFFSSHALYHPNTAAEAHKVLFTKDRYEWARTTPSNAARIIYVRDVWKQWYLLGTSQQVETPDSLTEKLRHLSSGFGDIVCVGVSAGAFAAVWHGTRLRARHIFSFAGQADLTLEVQTPEQCAKNPVVARMIATEPHLTRLAESLQVSNSTVYHLHGSASAQDLPHAELLKPHKQVTIVSFRSTLHGVPFSGRGLTWLIQSRIRTKLLLNVFSRLPPVHPKALKAIALLTTWPFLR